MITKSGVQFILAVPCMVGTLQEISHIGIVCHTVVHDFASGLLRLTHHLFVD